MSTAAKAVKRPRKTDLKIVAKEGPAPVREPVVEKKPLKVAQKPRLLDKIKTVKDSKEKKVIDNGENQPYSDVEKSMPQLTDEEKLVVEQLQQGPRLRDDVIADSTLPAARVGAILTMLEIKGILGRLPGNMLELK